MKALYAFRDDADFMIKFMGIVPANYSTVGEWVAKLDDEEAWPESHYGLYIDLENLTVVNLDEDEEVGGSVISLADLLEQALNKFYSTDLTMYVDGEYYPAKVERHSNDVVDQDVVVIKEAE